MPLSWNLGTLTSWNPLGHSMPVTGLLYLYIYLVSFQKNNTFWASEQIAEDLRIIYLTTLSNLRVNRAQWCENYWIDIGRLCKEAVLSYFKVLSTHLYEETKENHNKPEYSWCTCRDPNREPPKQKLKSLLLETRNVTWIFGYERDEGTEAVEN